MNFVAANLTRAEARAAAAEAGQAQNTQGEGSDCGPPAVRLVRPQRRLDLSRLSGVGERRGVVNSRWAAMQHKWLHALVAACQEARCRALRPPPPSPCVLASHDLIHTSRACPADSLAPHLLSSPNSPHYQPTFCPRRHQPQPAALQGRRRPLPGGIQPAVWQLAASVSRAGARLRPAAALRPAPF